MKIIAIYNLKGGVGKTATAVNLAYLASIEGAKTLLWDLDPQASTTFYYQVKAKIKGGMKKLMGNKSEIEEAIKSTHYDNLDILPADISTRNLDIILDDMKSSKKRLKNILSELSGDYDYVFIDSPPGFSVLSENIFSAADYLLLPMIPTTLSVRAFETITEYFQDNGLEKKKIIPFFSMVDLRKNMHKDIVDEYQNNKHLLKTSINYSSEVEKMGIFRAPLSAFAPRSKSAKAYHSLWKEFKSLITTKK
ncbi:ParA family protein [Solitalea canadensis]|uniref:ATPase involved in chromosome partitioning n=1 Tax=Solitalea canadensis (strain ATCC 29591 / DSM 3403 / JCM 21819 / LMG 8368 / NBRC 15130 / NCIMB 12057 / USAM 9D) TaxID=929556 RepID=H8KX64_SOLCM|nr:AAA family ATPase [Solitalea canadensis]AFD08393.1 ATPase involved in chromosome partitioning [Solitalea canadensis DSM 3403]